MRNKSLAIFLLLINAGLLAFIVLAEKKYDRANRYVYSASLRAPGNKQVLLESGVFFSGKAWDDFPEYDEQMKPISGSFGAGRYETSPRFLPDSISFCCFSFTNDTFYCLNSKLPVEKYKAALTNYTSEFALSVNMDLFDDGTAVLSLENPGDPIEIARFNAQKCDAKWKYRIPREQAVTLMNADVSYQAAFHFDHSKSATHAALDFWTDDELRYDFHDTTDVVAGAGKLPYSLSVYFKKKHDDDFEEPKKVIWFDSGEIAPIVAGQSGPAIFEVRFDKKDSLESVHLKVGKKRIQLTTLRQND